MDSSRKGHIAQLDGFRAIAVLLVLAMHFWRWPVGHPMLTGLFGGGWIGVDVFFVLSGYLITGILLSAKGDPAYYRNFYVRRSLRIFPLGYAVMIFTLCVRPLFSSDSALLLSVHDSAWYLFYASNIILAIRGFYGPLGMMWSLAVEEQFYFVWPAIMKWLSAERMKTLCVVIIIVSPIARAILLPHIGWRWCFMFTPLRADAFAWGAVIALGGHEFFKRFARPALYLSMAIVVSALSMKLFERELLWISSIGYTLTCMGAASGLWLALEAKRTWLTWAPLRYLGKISYGVYLLHATCVVVVSAIFPGTNGILGSVEFMVIATAVSVGVAAVSFRYYETPFLKLKSRFGDAPRTAAPGALATG